MDTKTRKSDHIRICLEKDVTYSKTNGFEKYEFEHNALPELDFDKIDVSTEFLGKRFSAPILIEAITGGSPESGGINRNLAKAAQKLGIGMGVGSQRAALEHPELEHTYRVRDVAPDIFLLGNIGGAQLAQHRDKAKKLMEMIGADALAIHLNSAQEMAQREGNRNFENVLQNIKHVAGSGVPVIVKEVGCGISGPVAAKLASSGVSAIDVAGAGGTSWIKVDYHRGEKTMENFLEWGIPTAECLAQCRTARIGVPVIASGGIRNGLEVAKAIAMGASLAGMALPLLKPATQSAEAVEEKLAEVIRELKTAMLLVGVRNIAELRKAKLVRL
jgi:isopentenyl-diphosphate delta-isomerase